MKNYTKMKRDHFRIIRCFKINIDKILNFGYVVDIEGLIFSQSIL